MGLGVVKITLSTWIIEDIAFLSRVILSIVNSTPEHVKKIIWLDGMSITYLLRKRDSIPFPDVEVVRM